MYGVAESIRTQITMDKILQNIVELIPAAWQYPEITRGKVIFDGKEYVSEPFTETRWKLSSEIFMDDKSRGTIEVYYLDECQELDEGPFLKEERTLINGIAKNINEAIEHKQAESELKKRMHQMEIFNRAAVDRELKMVELKKEINSLLEKAGLPKKYLTSG